MSSRARALLDEARLRLRQARLRRAERAALCRTGVLAFEAGAVPERAEARRLVEEIRRGQERLEDLARGREASLEADRADLGRVSGWVGPVVIVRGLATRAVLRHRGAQEARRMRPHYEALGAQVAACPELSEVRVRLREAERGLQRVGEPFGGTALPAWGARAGRESAGFARAVLAQLRSHFVPKVPAVAGMAVGWWIANTYTDSHLRSVLRSVGIGSGGTRVVSGSTYDAMRFWLPLLAAALCAYLGERLADRYRPERQER